MRLVADIGGTHARFALVGPDGQPGEVAKLKTADYPGPVEAARAYLGDRTVDEAVFAVATPVESDWVELTNACWAFSIRATQEALGLRRLEVINDFVAQALAVPALSAEERMKIGPGEPAAEAPIAVIGPGTGLGVAALVRIDGRWRPVASEGGHVSMAPHDAVEAEILLRLRERFGHVSNERVLSGPGLINLATTLAEIAGDSLALDRPEDVSRRAAAGECKHCAEALARFSSLLGAAAGDLALTFLARGGVYIGGGLCKRLGPLFDGERFRAAFVAKGRFDRYLAAIPTYMVIRQDPGLLGAAAMHLPA